MVDSDDSIWNVVFWFYLVGAVALTVLIPFIELPFTAKVVVGFADAGLYFLALNAKTGFGG